MNTHLRPLDDVHPQLKERDAEEGNSVDTEGRCRVQGVQLAPANQKVRQYASEITEEGAEPLARPVA